MSVTQGKLFPPQEELTRKETITPKKEEVKREAKTENKLVTQPVEKTAIQNVNIRIVPDGKILRVLKKDEKIMVLENQGKWSKVPEGYIMSEYLQ